MAGGVRPAEKQQILTADKVCFPKMQTGIQEAKAALRKQIHGVIREIAPATRDALSAQLRDRLKHQAIWQNAGAILLFAPLPDEADVWPLLAETLAAGKTVALPRFDAANNDYLACRIQHPQTEIAPGQFGIREPSARCAEISFDRLDLILVPGVAFDLQGRRLGRGRGFYDRLLADVSRAKCGIAFDQQLVEEVPAGPTDVRMDFILTPTRCEEIVG